MGTLSMKVLVVLVSVVACAAAQNVVCGKGSSTNKEVTVEDKKTYTFKTQKGKKYPGNTECTVKYKMGDSCAKMSFVCNKFNTNNKDKKKCTKGDKLTDCKWKSKSLLQDKEAESILHRGHLSGVHLGQEEERQWGDTQGEMYRGSREWYRYVGRLYNTHYTSFYLSIFITMNQKLLK